MKWRWTKRRDGDQYIKVGAFEIRIGPWPGTLNDQPWTFWCVNIEQHRIDLLLSRLCDNEKQAKRAARTMFRNHIRRQLRILSAAHTAMVASNERR
jgi:hypothetical protein